MKNLVSAEIFRLFKNKLFYALCVLSFIFGGAMQFYSYFGYKKIDSSANIDMTFFAIAMIIGFVVAVFVSSFVGTDYSDGTLRNKVICGKSRISIYFSKFIICCLAILIIYAAYYIGALIFGFIFNKAFTSNASAIIKTALILYFSTCAYVSIFLMIAMNWSKKSAVGIVTLILSIILFFTAVATSSILSEPEYYPEAVYVDENGDFRTEPEMPNPNYPTGTKRKVYELLYDINPTGQCVQLSGAVEESTSKNNHNFLAYSGAIIIISTALGVKLFKKKDIV